MRSILRCYRSEYTLIISAVRIGESGGGGGLMGGTGDASRERLLSDVINRRRLLRISDRSGGRAMDRRRGMKRGKWSQRWSEAFNQPDSVSLNATLDEATDRVTVSLRVSLDV